MQNLSQFLGGCFFPPPCIHAFACHSMDGCMHACFEVSLTTLNGARNSNAIKWNIWVDDFKFDKE